jgi:hypothetical protein
MLSPAVRPPRQSSEISQLDQHVRSNGRTVRWTIDGLLGGGGSVNGSHETFNDTELEVRKVTRMLIAK